jgi:hypothetical protein
MSCGTGLRFDNTNAYYLLNHPNLDWVDTNTTEMTKIPDVIWLARYQQLPFMVGRTIYKGEWTLGKAHAGATFFLFNFWDGAIEPRYYTNYQVLVCRPKVANSVTTPREPTTSTLSTTTSLTTTTQASTTTANPYKCGDLLPFANYDVTKLGLNSGTFYDGSTIFVGTADFGQCWWQYDSPARISTANSFKGPGG